MYGMASSETFLLNLIFKKPCRTCYKRQEMIHLERGLRLSNNPWQNSYPLELFSSMTSKTKYVDRLIIVQPEQTIKMVEIYLVSHMIEFPQFWLFAL